VQKYYHAGRVCASLPLGHSAADVTDSYGVNSALWGP